MPSFPHSGFSNIQMAREWVASFVNYYNNDHHHSSLKFITPNQRHDDLWKDILNKRKKILQAAKAKHPERWAGPIQNCTLEEIVWLNPTKEKNEQEIC
jgi:putative transposase